MQIYWWLFGVALAAELGCRSLLVLLGRAARRGVSGMEIIAVSLAPLFCVGLVLRFAGIAAAFVLAVRLNGNAAVVLYGVGSLWSAVTVAEVVQAVWTSRRVGRVDL